VKTRSTQQAFLLIDSIAALALFSGGILLAVTFFHTEVRVIRTTHEVSVGRMLAESELERLAALPYDMIATGENQPLKLTLPAAATLKAIRGILSVRETRPGLKEATVCIIWKTPRKHDLQAKMTRYYAREAQP